MKFETRSAASVATAVDAGPMPSSQRVSVTLTFAPTAARSTALTQFLSELTNGSSSNYRKWITPAQFASSYGATDDQLTAATGWAEAHGLTVDAVSPAGSRITISGFTAQIQAAFAVTLDGYKINGATHFANVGQPSLPAEIAVLFSAIDGLDDLPANTALTISGAPTSFAALAQMVDANSTPLLNLTSGLCSSEISSSQLAQYKLLFEQAAAQGMTTLATRTCSGGGFPGVLAEVTSVALPGDLPETSAQLTARPGWQAAPGLPSDGFRHAPDLTGSSAVTLAQTLTSIAASVPGGRLGNINPVLYELGPTQGLYTQPDDAAAGTWEPATGLGLVDLEKLAKAFPRGTGSSFVSLSVSSYSPLYGSPLTFTSSVTSGTGGAIPSGTVSYTTTAGTTVCGPITVDANGNTSCTTTTLASGSYQIVASYSGDGTYAPAVSSPPAGVTVQAPTSTLSGTVSSGNIVGSTFTTTITSTVPAGSPQPTGNITLSISGTSTSWTLPLVAITPTSSAAAFTEPASTVGTLTLSATCSGTTNFSCPNPLTENVTIAKANPTLNISYTPDPPVSGQTINLTGTMTGNGTAPIPTGTVTFYDNNVGLNSASINANGVATTSAALPTTATHSITAIYNGDANYNSVNNSPSTPMGGTSTTSALLTTTSNTVTTTQAFTLSVKITPTTVINSTQPTGTVQILDGSTVILTPTLTNGRADISTTLTTVGAHSLTAVYAGDSNYGGSTAPAITITVSSASTGASASSTIITSSSYAVSYGSTYTLTAGVKAATAGGTTPSGSVTFAVAGGATLVTVPLTNGLASYAIATAPNVGSYAYTATYGGDTIYAGSTSPASTPVVISPAVATIVATVNPTTVGTSASSTLSATVTIPGSSVPPTGIVTATVPGVTGAVYTGTLVTTGTNAASVNIVIPAPPAGTYTLQVTCAGTANFTCTPATAALTSTAGTTGATPSGIVLSSSNYNGVAGTNVTLTAKVNGTVAAGTAPTGIVNFYINSATPQLLGSATLVASGTGISLATINTTNIPAGTQAVFAVYVGDTVFAGSTSAPISIGVADYAIVFTPPTITIARGETGTVALQINTTGGFSGSIALGCSPPANVEITCSLTTTSLSGSGTSTLTINTVAPKAAENDLPGFKAVGGVSFAALLCFLLPIKGKEGKRRRLPGLLLILLAVGLTVNLGCGGTTTVSSPVGGTPLGTVNLTIYSAGTNGTSSLNHDYSYQVTIE